MNKRLDRLTDFLENAPRREVMGPPCPICRRRLDVAPLDVFRIMQMQMPIEGMTEVLDEIAYRAGRDALIAGCLRCESFYALDLDS
jgi:hypothetical protein